MAGRDSRGFAVVLTLLVGIVGAVVLGTLAGARRTDSSLRRFNDSSRAADVTLKERRTLIVVPRETPLTRATLRHLLALDEAGATVLPASPAFYAGARDIDALVDFVAGKVLDALGVEHDLFRRWTGQLGGNRADEG